MSYILDALKKAEAERDPEARASLAMAQHERRRNRWLAYAVVIALIANAAILLWLFLPEPRTELATTLAQTPVQQTAEQEDRAVRRVEETSSGSQSPVAAPETARQSPPPTATTPGREPSQPPQQPQKQQEDRHASSIESLPRVSTLPATSHSPLPSKKKFKGQVPQGHRRRQRRRPLQDLQPKPSCLWASDPCCSTHRCPA